MYTGLLYEKHVGILVDCLWLHGRRVSEKERVGEREKKGGNREKWFEGKECLFAFV